MRSGVPLFAFFVSSRSTSAPVGQRRTGISLDKAYRTGNTVAAFLLRARFVSMPSIDTLELEFFSKKLYLPELVCHPEAALRPNFMFGRGLRRVAGLLFFVAFSMNFSRFVECSSFFFSTSTNFSCHFHKSGLLSLLLWGALCPSAQDFVLNEKETTLEKTL